MMKPDHIKEAIPSLGLRIRFENLYAKYLSGLDEVIILDKTNVKTVDLLDIMDGENSVNIDRFLEPLPSPNKFEVKLASSSKEKIYLRTAEVFNCVICK